MPFSCLDQHLATASTLQPIYCEYNERTRLRAKQRGRIARGYDTDTNRRKRTESERRSTVVARCSRKIESSVINTFYDNLQIPRILTREQDTNLQNTNQDNTTARKARGGDRYGMTTWTNGDKQGRP